MKNESPQQTESPKKKASEHLRNVDRLLKAGQHAEALQEVEQALELDPNNAYALAYKQRITRAMAQTTLAPPPLIKPEAKEPPKAEAVQGTQEEAARKSQRKLAAIVFTDIVAYSAITQRSETGALQLLEVHNRILRPIFLKHEGNVVKTIGDSFLVEFTSVLQAVRCAIEIQDSIAQHNATASEELQMKIRIGIHLGDVVYQDNDIFGDGVNIASRLQERADPGGICVSQDVYNQIRNREGFHTEYIGETELKNIRTPISLYHVLTSEQVQRKAFDAAINKAHEEGIAAAREKKLEGYLSRAEELIGQKSYDEAIIEAMKLQALDAQHPQARSLIERIRKERQEAWKKDVTEAKKVPRQTVLEMYGRVVQQVKSGESLTPEEDALLKNLRTNLQISEEEDRTIEQANHP
jgi:class 3 adenylate cyclase